MGLEPTAHPNRPLQVEFCRIVSYRTELRGWPVLAAVAVAVAVGQVERAAFTVQTGVPAFSTLSYLEKPCHMCGLIPDQPLPLLLLLLLINLLRKGLRG